jgi:dTDP-4-dehydrorhamnose 3,5-epimerase
MTIKESPLPGLLIVEPDVFEDARGYFFESYNRKEMEAAGINPLFVQDNQSLSRQGVIRGLHYQLAPYAQSKLVRVLQGSVWDVAVDIRQNSPTFGKHFAIELSADNQIQLYIPQGFAHGFAVTSESALFFYKCDNYYHPGADRGINHADPALAIPWPFRAAQAMVSAKDQVLPLLKDAEMNFIYQK